MPIQTIQRRSDSPHHQPQPSARRPLTTTPPAAASAHQTPNTPSASTESVYVLSLAISPQISHAMNDLRAAYFPPHLNRLPAHLTLFHALPASHLESTILPALTTLAANTPSYHIRAGDARRMKRGVLITLHHSKSPHRTTELARDLQRQWGHFLSKQDLGLARPHWTVMNKVNNPDHVEKVHGEVEAWLKREKGRKDKERRTVEGWVEGIVLWRYDKGNWVEPRRLMFTGEEQ